MCISPESKEEEEQEEDKISSSRGDVLRGEEGGREAAELRLLGTV
jgi:hypothetical protein